MGFWKPRERVFFRSFLGFGSQGRAIVIKKLFRACEKKKKMRNDCATDTEYHHRKQNFDKQIQHRAFTQGE